MSQIRCKDTKPEIVVRKFLHSNGMRFRLHNKNLPGKPDLTLSRHKTVIFVNGCFWHGHQGCKYFVIPKTRTKWWQDKIDTTKNRDRENMKKLNELGWNTIIIWECDLKPDKRKTTLEILLKSITKNRELSNA